MVISLGSIFQALTAISTAASLEPPKRLMPLVLPRSCCGSLISGREISCMGELVFQGRDDHHRGAADGAQHCRRRSRLCELDASAEQGLNVRRSRLNQNDFQIDAVFLAKPQFLIDP